MSNLWRILRLLASLRVWFYQQLEPLAPARLQHYRGGDLLSRIRADIDILDHFYLRILVPTITAVLGGVSFVLFLLRYDARLALILLLCLLLSGVAVPWLVRRLGDAPGRRTVTLKAELRAAAIDGVQGLAELQVYGATRARAERIKDLSRQLANEQERLSGLAGLSRGAIGLAANLAMWLTVWTAIPLVQDGNLVLDEPTEGLDNPTARALMTTIGTLMTERSVLLITHKPEGLETMDEILVLEQGRIVARGDHRRLLSDLPDYRALWGVLDEFQPSK